MAKVEIYATPICSYCARAKRLLMTRGASFTEINVFEEPRRRVEMIQRAGGRNTVPQIFIDDAHIGGYDDLQELDRVGKLTSLLATA